MIYKTNYKKMKILMLCSLLIFGAISENIVAQVVTNGGFENSEVGAYIADEINGWVIEFNSAVDPAPVFEIITDDVKEGSKALKVSIDGTGADQWDIQIVADSLPVAQETEYNFSIWAKSDVANTQVNFTVGNYDYTEYSVIRPATLTTEWTEYKMTFTVNDGEGVIRAPIHFSYAGNSGANIYIDNLKIYNESFGKTPVVIEAESGELGSDFITEQDGDITYVTASQNSTTFVPEGPEKMITYQVTFQDSGYYNLFARVYVGASTFDDDSFIAARGFDVKSDTASNDWVLVNGLAGAGFTGEDKVVNDLGIAADQVWKWVNVSKNFYSYDQFQDTLYVSPDSLTKTFKIASREDGLLIDKIAFAKSNLLYTVKALDNQLPGVIEVDNPVEVYEGPPLASKQPKFVGNIYSSPQKNNFESYWNQVIPENAGKWGSVEGSRDNMNWTELDASYKLAKDNGFPFTFHVLLWGSQQPAWINDLEPEEQLEEIREWYQAVADRYPDIDYLQVVNEPLFGHNPPDGNNGRANYKEALGGGGSTNWDWVINAFRMAKEIFPDTKLMLNDFGIIGDPNSTKKYLQIILLLQAEGLIDVIGVQGHAFTTVASTGILLANLNTLGETGLPVHVTELDIDGPTDAVQLAGYKRIFLSLYEHPAVEGITLWGWRPGLWRSDEGAYIINESGEERPALVWLRDYLDSVDVTVGVEDANDVLPENFALEQNYPNPFNPTTNIRYSIAKSSEVSLKVFDMLGREVATLVNTVKGPGNYTLEFNANNLPSGIYFYRIQAGSFTATKKLMLLK